MNIVNLTLYISKFVLNFPQNEKKMQLNNMLLIFTFIVFDFTQF